MTAVAREGEPPGPDPILIVEDEPDLLVTCERLLRRQGIRVIGAGSCAEGLAAIRGGALSLVIADLRLPDGDGLAVVAAARAGPRPVPVVVVTGYPSDEARRSALSAGAAEFVPKPFSASLLAALVERVLACRPGWPAPIS